MTFTLKKKNIIMKIIKTINSNKLMKEIIHNKKTVNKNKFTMKHNKKRIKKETN